MRGCKEQWSRLIWIADVAALLRHGVLDWRAILDRAYAVGARRMLLIGIILARDLLGHTRGRGRAGGGSRCGSAPPRG